jgi:Phage integrase, N-terminal SAM-like domain
LESPAQQPTTHNTVCNRKDSVRCIPMSEIEIWTKPLARRTLPRVRASADRERERVDISWVTEKGGLHDPTSPKMLEELQRRHYAYRTSNTYIGIVRDFAAYFRRPPDKLGPEHIRQYQAYLFQRKKLSPASVSQYVSALRFLYVKTLRRHFLRAHSLSQISPAAARRAQP